MLPLWTVLGIAEEEIAESGESYGRRYRSPDAVRGEPLSERAPQIEAPVQVGVHASDRQHGRLGRGAIGSRAGPSG